MIPIHFEVSNYMSTKNSLHERLITPDRSVQSYDIKVPVQNVTASTKSSVNTSSSRRGRRSTVPLEIRDQVRRLKKQHTERQRRACISDKMNALHNLAMKLIGEVPVKHSKMEKTDILGICYTIFEGIARILKDRPELLNRLHNLASSCLEIKDSKNTCQYSDSISLQSNSSITSSKYSYKHEKKSRQKNVSHQSFQSELYSSSIQEVNKNLSPVSCQNINEIVNSCIKMETKQFFNENNEKFNSVYNKSYKCQPFRLPLKYRWSKIDNHNIIDKYNYTPNDIKTHEINNQLDFEQKCAQFNDNLISRQYSVINNDEKENIQYLHNEQNVWRPYLN
ncbi:unnamed protein product [Heterobilharzia americana]|nr:unnamed protein product [Heterobilharzia americana]